MFRRFLTYYRGQIHLFVIDIAAALTVAGVDLAFPQILRSLAGGVALIAAALAYRRLARRRDEER